ncbi:MAG TPA: L,D-transpeptidase [Vicinamibacterales bacterium]|nr:L,D-transpeptidase [Vicinamibacterales bacterium]
MNTRVPTSLMVAAILAAASSVIAQQPAPAAPKPLSGFPALETQVLLDLEGFSPGEIDGRGGPNTRKALAAYTEARKAPPTPVANVTTTYVITEADVAGPFVEIPTDMMAKAKLTSLGYTTALEALGERFHASPSLLKALNPGATFAAGATITVPAVRPFELKPEVVPATEGVTVAVSKGESSLRVYDSAGTLLMYAPVTSGSEHDPLPLGDWTVTAVLRNPTFNYNPDLFWDADPTHSKATIPAGPNGPVGVVWIDISKEHYGLHGTPEPSRIGHSDSHGCVRLTNWDASRLAGLVRKGIPVQFVK